MQPPEKTLSAVAPARRLEQFATPGFLVALAVLALNDHVLKAAYPGLLTGKLSDLAGLFAFAVFLSACWPRYRTTLHIVVGLAFVLWKSAITNDVIGAWNSLGIWPVARVLDSTDLIALTILPLSWWYSGRARGIHRLLPARPVIAALSVVILAATSRKPRTYSDGTVFVVPMSRDKSWQAIDELDHADSTFRIKGRRRGVATDTLSVSFEEFDVTLELKSAMTGETLITLTAISIVRYELDAITARADVNTAIITPLRERRGP